jgi:hypothetical protein
MVALVVVAVTSRERSPGLPSLVVQQGEFFDVWRDGEKVLDGRLHSGDRIQTGSEGSARLSFDEGRSIIALSGAVDLVYEAEATGRTFRLHAGELSCAIAKLPPGESLQLSTEAMAVEVVGTRFRLNAEDGGRLSLEEGRVKVTHHSNGNSVMLDAGQHIDARSMQAVPERLSNGGFEAGLSAWSVQSRELLTVMEDPAGRLGDVLCIDLNSDQDPGIFQDLSIEAGRSYDFAMWLRMAEVSPPGVELQIIWLRDQAQVELSDVESLQPFGLIGRDVIGPKAGTKAWQREAIRIQAPPGARFLRFRIYCRSDRQTGQVWLDDLQVCPAHEEAEE